MNDIYLMPREGLLAEVKRLQAIVAESPAKETVYYVDPLDCSITKVQGQFAGGALLHKLEETLAEQVELGNAKWVTGEQLIPCVARCENNTLTTLTDWFLVPIDAEGNPLDIGMILPEDTPGLDKLTAHDQREVADFRQLLQTGTCPYCKRPIEAGNS